MGGSPPPGARSLRERFGALRNLPPFLKLVWQTSPGLTIGTLVLRLVRALLPVATLFVGKLIIDSVVAAAQTPGAPTTLSGWYERGLLDRLLWLLAAEFALAVLSDVLGRRRVAPRLAPVGAVLEHHERASHGARGHAGPRRLRGQRAAGPARSRSSSGIRAHDLDEPAVRSGAGHRHRSSASRPVSWCTRRGSSCSSSSRSSPRSSAKRTSTRRATRSRTRERPSNASSTTYARPARASRARRK